MTPTLQQQRAAMASTYALVARTRGMSAVQQFEMWGAVYWMRPCPHVPVTTRKVST